MKARVGDVISVDSEKAGTPPREGNVLEVIEAEFGTRYRVRWEDGHESTIHPPGRVDPRPRTEGRSAGRSLALAQTHLGRRLLAYDLAGSGGGVLRSGLCPRVQPGQSRW